MGGPLRKKIPPALKKKMGGTLKNAPQAGILPPGEFVYTGAAVLFRSILLCPKWSTVFIRRPVLGARYITY